MRIVLIDESNNCTHAHDGGYLRAVWEAMQPRTMLFKTNYFEQARFEAQAVALAETIAWFDAEKGAAPA